MPARTQLAADDPQNAVEIGGVEWHANELTYASPNQRDKYAAVCNRQCGWRRAYSDLPADDAGYTKLPPWCPRCWTDDTISPTRRAAVDGGAS